MCHSLESPTASVSWDDSCRRDLRWWSDPSLLVVGVDLSLPHPELMLFTDASDARWGTSLGSDHLSGLWSREVSLYSINHRELLAVFLAIRGFLHLLRGRSVSLFTDNTSALSYFCKEGGTRSSTLNSVAQAILRLCEDSDVRLLPQFVPGRLNVLADSLSLSGQVLGSEWTLHRDVPRTFPPLAGHGGFVRHLPQPPPPGVFFPYGGSSGGGGGCSDPIMGSSSGLRLPSVQPYPEGAFQGERLPQPGADSRGSLLATPALVSGSPRPSSGGPSPSSSTSGFAPPAPLPSVSQEPPRTGADWVSYCQ